MSERLAGTVALVTGASSGIGRATAVQLAAEGAAVALVARRRERLEELAARIDAAGGRSLIVAADITGAEAAAGVVAETVEALGRLDLVVNAAGVGLSGDSVTAPAEHWDRMVDLNLKALMHVTKAALPHLLDAVASSPRAVADVINVSSTAGRQTFPQAAIYSATKFAVTAATDAWRLEYTRRNVRFAAIEPGLVETEFADQQESTRAMYEQLRASHEMLTAEDVADTIAYVVTRPRRVAISEVLLRPTDQV